MPSLIEFVKQRQSQGLGLVLINVGEDTRTVQRVVRDRGYDVPVLLDPDDKAQRAFGITATPTVVVVGRSGTALGAAIGPRAWTEREGRALLDAVQELVDFAYFLDTVQHSHAASVEVLKLAEAALPALSAKAAASLPDPRPAAASRLAGLAVSAPGPMPEPPRPKKKSGKRRVG